MPKKFSAIIFDLGNVIYDIDISLSVQAFAGLGLPDFQELFSLKKQSGLFDKLETGDVDFEDFCDMLNEIAGKDLGRHNILVAWNALLVGIPPENIQTIKEVRKTYPIYILSNTNKIHLEGISEYLQRDYHVKDLSVWFDKAYYSCDIGMRKPGRDIYDYVINDIGFPAEDILFIDDNEDNIKAAEKTGLNILLKRKENDLRKLLEDNGVI